MIGHSVRIYLGNRSLMGVAALLLAALVGCGEPGLQRVAVSGVVSLEGKPVDNATIIFTPDGVGLAAAASIENGKFSLTDEDGPTAGSHTVRINPNEAEMEEVSPADLAKAGRRPRIPKVYQQPGELVANVTGEPEQQLTFELKTQR